MPRSLVQTAAFGLVLLLVILAYQPGLAGGFLFDDYPNLQAMGDRGGVVDLETLKAFVMTGFSGPTGRPLALMSFLLDDNTWPSSGSFFKATSLLIHCLTGVVLCWVTLLILRLHGFHEERAVWVAVLSMAFWLLHPYLVSTTLYVVQRMAQLATLFVLCGLLGYLHGRTLVALRARRAYVWMSLSIVLGGTLAFLSKENGALLPLLILVVEYSVLSARGIVPARWWRVLFLWIPSLALLYGLLRHIDFSPAPWPNRDFNQIERLLSEGRILWEYLGALWVPRLEGRGLFQDGYQISRGLLQPVSSLLAWLGIFFILILAFVLRRRWPLVSLAVLFFFAGHLLESTLLGLELYFEHRNYLPAVFLFLPLAQGLVWLCMSNYSKAGLATAGLLLTMLAVMTFQRATLWSDTERLQLFWAAGVPESPRGQVALVDHYEGIGEAAAARALLADAMQRLPESGLLTIRYLLQRIHEGTLHNGDFEWLLRRLAFQRMDSQVLNGLRVSLDAIIESGRPEDFEGMLRLLDGLAHVENYGQMSDFLSFHHYAKGRLLALQQKYDAARESYSIAMRSYDDISISLMMVAEMASAGSPMHALQMLDLACGLYEESGDSLTRPIAYYLPEIERLRKVLSDQRT